MFHEVAHGLGIKNTITGKGNLLVSEVAKELLTYIRAHDPNIID